MSLVLDMFNQANVILSREKFMALVVNEQSNTTSNTEGLEMFIQAGELYFGNAPTLVSTMLHSRTAISFWHPATRIGGLCHVVKAESPSGEQDMQYGNCAIEEFARLADKYHTPLSEYEVKIFGGAVKDGKDARQHEITLDTICSLVKKNGFKVSQINGLSANSRKLRLDLSTGVVASREVARTSGENHKARVSSKSHDSAMEIFLHPGEIYFGKEPTIISTLLGSCVAATLWHPKEKVGGMCHIVLPESPEGKCEMKYGDCAIDEFVKQITRYQTQAKDYVVNLYGGSDMFPDMEKSAGMKIGERNLKKTQQLLEHYNFRISEVDAGGTHSRKIRLDLSNGSVGIRKHGKS